MYVCTYVCMYACVHVCMYVYTYVFPGMQPVVEPSFDWEIIPHAPRPKLKTEKNWNNLPSLNRFFQSQSRSRSGSIDSSLFVQSYNPTNKPFTRATPILPNNRLKRWGCYKPRILQPPMRIFASSFQKKHPCLMNDVLGFEYDLASIKFVIRHCLLDILECPFTVLKKYKILEIKTKIAMKSPKFLSNPIKSH